jgi:hypothetical protein
MEKTTKTKASQTQEVLAGVLGQCRELAHLACRSAGTVPGAGAPCLQECWDSAGSWRTSISATITTKTKASQTQEVPQSFYFFCMLSHLFLLHTVADTACSQTACKAVQVRRNFDLFGNVAKIRRWTKGIPLTKGERTKDLELLSAP